MNFITKRSRITAGKGLWLTSLAGIAGLALALSSAAGYLAVDKKTEPKIITPGAASTPEAPGKAPSDAIVLFDGTDLSKWHGGAADKPAPWKVENGYAQVGGGGIYTREEFGDCQLHVEWASPSEVKGDSQGRGNSGVYLQGRYEVQVLDSFNNKTYFDGQAASIYGIAPPLVNACREPGQWQTYDIIFRAPTAGKPGRITVLHNGVLVQDNTPVGDKATVAAPAAGKAAKGPIHLQDHGNPVRYRNIWIRPLGPDRFADEK